MTNVAIDLKPTLSPTALGNYLTCGRRGQYYHQKIIPTVTTVGLALGGAWHKGMETFQQARMYYGDRLLGLMPADLLIDNLYQIMAGHFAEEAAQEDFVWGNGESVGEVHERLHKMISAWTAHDGNKWMGNETTPIATEEEVVVEFGSNNHVMRGFIDLILDSPHGVIGVDHKTAGRAWGGTKAAGDPRKLIQAPLYAEAYMRLTGVEMNHFCYDVVTYAGKVQRVWVNVSQEVREPFIKRWQEMSDEIYTMEMAGLDMPTNPDANLCSEKWCSYWSICPMGEALDRKMINV